MAKNPPATKRTSLRILKVRRSRKTISIDYKNGDESHSITSRDNPKASFTQALDALPPLVCDLLGLFPGYAETMKAKGITLTDGENEQVTIVAEKSLSDFNSPFNIATPLRFMALPQKPGAYTAPLTPAQVALIDEVVEQAKGYILLDREQGQIAFDDAKGADDGSGEVEPKGDATAPLPFTPEKAEEPKPAKQKRGSKRGGGRAAAR